MATKLREYQEAVHLCRPEANQALEDFKRERMELVKDIIEVCIEQKERHFTYLQFHSMSTPRNARIGSTSFLLCVRNYRKLLASKRTLFLVLQSPVVTLNIIQYSIEDKFLELGYMRSDLRHLSRKPEVDQVTPLTDRSAFSVSWSFVYLLYLVSLETHQATS